MLEAERSRVFESWKYAHKAILFKVARVYGATHSDREDLFQGMFTVGVGALWVSRGPRPEPPRNLGNTLQEEVRRNLALVDYQLSRGNPIIVVLGATSLVVGTLLFSWTVNRSQDIPDSSSGRWWIILLVFWVVWVFHQAGNERRKTKAKLEPRQRRLQLLAALEARE